MKPLHLRRFALRATEDATLAADLAQETVFHSLRATREALRTLGREPANDENEP